MKERPILFSGEMVRAILAGRKTQTRRIVKLPTKYFPTGECAFADQNGLKTGCGAAHFHIKDNCSLHLSCPFGTIGDRLWVRETFRLSLRGTDDGDGYERLIVYRADGDTYLDTNAFVLNPDNNAEWDMAEHSKRGYLWRPSIFMPRWASRITLEVTSVRVERLQAISEEDAQAEVPSDDRGFYFVHTTKPKNTYYNRAARGIFTLLWEEINGDRASWESNPFVWVVSFKVIS